MYQADVEVKALSDMVVEKHNLLLTIGATLEELRGDAAARSDASAGARARVGRWVHVAVGGHGRVEVFWEGLRGVVMWPPRA